MALTLREVVIDVLVAVSVTTAALSCLGLAMMRTPLQRLHYLGPLAMVAPVLLCGAVAIARNTSSGASLKAVLIGVLVVSFAPVISHQIGQMAEARRDSP